MQHNIELLKNKLLPIYFDFSNRYANNKELCPFLMQWGSKFPTIKNNGIIFYGRATNGWNSTWDYDIFFSDNHKDSAWNKNTQWIYDSDIDYNYHKSQFWSIIEGISMHIYGQEWYDYVACSNICKVAPNSAGNPSNKIFYDTLENNIKIFNIELDFWSPKYVVLFTDGIRKDAKTVIDWTSCFIKSLNNNTMPKLSYELSWDEEKPDMKIRIYKLGEMYIIQSVHPQGQKVDLHKDAIINIIERIENKQV